MSFLVVNSLEKRFGTVEVLKGIDISVPQGGFLVLVGPSGCGKSTLLNTIAGLETVSAGEILIDGARVNELHPSKRDIAMVFQSYALYPNMNVAKNMSFGMEMRGVPRAERQQVVARVASMLQIEDLLHRKPGQLSGGQRQRVAMGRALVRDPRSSCSTSRSPTSTPSSASRCAPRFRSCTSGWGPPSSTSPTTRSRR